MKLAKKKIDEIIDHLDQPERGLSYDLEELTEEEHMGLGEWAGPVLTVEEAEAVDKHLKAAVIAALQEIST